MDGAGLLISDRKLFILQTDKHLLLQFQDCEQTEYGWGYKGVCGWAAILLASGVREMIPPGAWGGRWDSRGVCL